MGIINALVKSTTPTTPERFALLTALITVFVLNPVIGLIALLVTAVLAQARENYGILEESGVPLVKPTWFCGSEPNIHKTVLHLADIERFKKFGGIWGSYVGRSPQIYIADPELIRLIFVKDFVHFGDRQEVDFGSPVLNEVLDFLPGEKWKYLRTCLSPLFTTSKLKQMSGVIATSAAEFIEDLKSECDSTGRLKIDCRKRLTTWLIDMFAQTTLGIRLEDSKNPDNKFAQAFREMMGENQEYDYLFSLSLSFPFLSRFAPTFNHQPTSLIASTFTQIIESRQKQQAGKQNTKDFSDVLCDLWERIPSQEFKQLGITKTTVVAQAINFFLGGYDTSATTLSHLLLALANKPDIQEKMHTELLEALARRRQSDKGIEKDQPEIDHELIQDSEIPYITSCINESLRLAPPLGRPERICTKDWDYKGISIKKGTVVMLAAWAANRNPMVYSDRPEEFVPERFLPENKGKLDPYGFSSFGFGPRNCIGMRFAYENLKLFTCNLVKNFRVEKRADTSMNYKPGTTVLLGFGSLYLDLVQRK